MSTAIPPEQQGEQLTRMSFGDHLDELRRRLIRAVGAMLLAVVCIIPFKHQVQEIIIGPYRTLWLTTYDEWIEHLTERGQAREVLLAEAATLEANSEVDAAATKRMLAENQLDADGLAWLAFDRENHQRIFDGTYPWWHILKEKTGFNMSYELFATDGIQDFWTFMMASLLFALVVASPVVLWQFWAFISAGLYKRERKVVRRLFPLFCGLLVGGILFGYFFVVPYGLYFLVRLKSPGLVAPLLTVATYFNFLFLLTAALGVVFQLPLFMLAMQKVGLMTHQGFKKHWRGVILAIWVVAALMTPPDPFTQGLMACPLILLFLFGLFLTRWSARKDDEGELGRVRAAGGGGSGEAES